MKDLSPGIALALIGICFASCAPAPEPEPPNIVFILIDDLGWADLPAYGNRFHETPHIDRLVAEGMRFTDAYAAAPVCSPTRASIQSGQYPARVGVTDFIPGHWRPYEEVTVPTNRTQHLPAEVVTYAEALQEAGYNTGYFGKWHLNHLGTQELMPWDQGYDSVVVYSGWGHFELQNKLVPPQDVPPDAYLSEVLTDRSVAFLEAHQDQPFILTLAHFAVHIPLEAEEELIAKYETKPKPEEGVNNPVYAAMIEHVDRSVGRVLDALDRLGLTENTFVVFYSDNGGLRERFDRADGVVVSTNAPLRDEKGSLYEGGIRVPLIVRWPGRVPAGRTSDAIVSSIDLLPTFLDLAHVPPPVGQTVDGISLIPMVTGGAAADPDRAVYFHYPHYHHSSPAGAVREGDYKLLEFYDDGHLELYNLAEDIGEENDLSAELSQRAERMQRMLQTWRQEVGADMPEPNPDFDAERREEWGTHPDVRSAGERGYE